MARTGSHGRGRRAPGPCSIAIHQDQIETLGRLLRQTRRATARGAGDAAQGRVRRIRLAAPGDGVIPGIDLRRGYTTAVSFTGATGAPWPIAEALIDRRFLPPGEEGGPDAPRPAAAICFISRLVRPISRATPW